MHSLVAHGNAIRDRNGAKLQRVAAPSVDTLFGRLRQATKGEVAGGYFIPRARNTDLGLDPVVVSHADGAQHTPRGGCFNTVGDDT